MRRPFDVEHHDPAPVGRAAAVRSVREKDPRTRDDGRRMSAAERLRAGFALSRAAGRLRGAARG